MIPWDKRSLSLFLTVSFGLIRLPLLTAPDVNMALGGTVTSLTGWIPLAALAAWLWLSGRLTPRPAPPAENGAPPDLPGMRRV